MAVFGGGWVAFFVSIILIGIMTAFIGDLASHMGCSMGLKDSVNAICFVALGTSIPGTVTVSPGECTHSSMERKKDRQKYWQQPVDMLLTICNFYVCHLSCMM